MQREIKFRALSVSRNFTYGYFCKDVYGDGYITTLNGEDTSRVNPETVGQFTGLVDKKGTEIYEGDIMQYECESKEGAKHTYTIVVDDMCSFYYRVIWAEDNSDFGGLSRKVLEVIGNIHQHKHLLE